MVNSGTRTPPPRAEAGGGVLQEGDELTVGGQYWMQDDTGDEVWTLGEVLERGEDGNVSIKLLERGGVIEIDPVRTARPVSVCCSSFFEPVCTHTHTHTSADEQTHSRSCCCCLRTLPAPEGDCLYSLRSSPSLWWCFQHAVGLMLDRFGRERERGGVGCVRESEECFDLSGAAARLVLLSPIADPSCADRKASEPVLSLLGCLPLPPRGTLPFLASIFPSSFQEAYKFQKPNRFFFFFYMKRQEEEKNTRFFLFRVFAPLAI